MALENNQIGSSNLDNDEISLKDLVLKIKNWIAFLNSKWKIIILAGLIGGILGVIIAINNKPNYKAVLTFAMEDDKGSGVGGLSGAIGLASSFGIDLGSQGGGAFAATNIIELMKSRTLVEKVLLKQINIKGKNTSLAEFFINLNRLRDDWKKIPALNNINYFQVIDRSNFTLQQDSILGSIYNSVINKDVLNISQKDKKVTILTIEVRNENELFAKLFCENLAQEVSEFYIATKVKKATLNVNILQKQVDSVKNELNAAINGVATETDNVYNLNPAFNIKASSSKKKQVDVQANTAILTNLVVQLELAKITLRKETPLIQLIDKPILPLEKDKLGKLKSLVFGGLLGGFLSALYLIFGQLYKRMLS